MKNLISNRMVKIEDFSPRVLKEINLEKFDWETYKYYLVFKTIDEGELSDWKLIQDKYGRDEVKKVSMEIEGLDIVSVTFLSSVFNVDITEFKSYHPDLTSKGFRQKMARISNDIFFEIQN